MRRVGLAALVVSGAASGFALPSSEPAPARESRRDEASSLKRDGAGAIVAAGGIHGANAGVLVLSRITGVVATREGHPLPGALVSVLAADAERGEETQFAVTDEEGRFDVGAEPGLYSLRAYLAGFLPSPRAEVQVERGASLADTLLIQMAALRAEAASGSLSELRWLLQRGRRNVLRDRRAGLDDFEGGFNDPWTHRGENPLVPALASLEGEFGFLAASGTLLGLSESRGADSGIAYSRFALPSTARGHWEAEVRLIESALASWAAHLSYRMEEFDGHQFAAGIGYQRHVYGDAGDYRPHAAPILSPALLHEPQAEWDGAAFVSDDFSLGPASLSTGLTYRRFSYLRGHQGLAPRAVLEIEATDRLTFVGGAAARVDGPIGEDAALLSRVVHGDLLAADPSWFRTQAAQRSTRYQAAIEYQVSAHAAVTARVFRDDTTDQLVRAFESGPVGGGHFDVANAGHYRARGIGVHLARETAPVHRRLDLGARVSWVAAIVEGRAGALAERPIPGAAALAADLAPVAEAAGLPPGAEVLLHDVSLEGAARIRPSGTRIQGAVRWMFHPGLMPGLTVPATGAGPGTTARFDVELIQLIPFSAHGTEWEFSLAVRDLFFRDIADRALLDELAVARAPRRIIGGLAVRF